MSSVSANSLIVKAELKDDIRRFAAPKTISFAELQNRLRQLFGLGTQNFTLKVCVFVSLTRRPKLTVNVVCR
jgi:hypothetical protein